MACFTIAVAITQSDTLQARQAVAESDWIELEFRSPEFLSWLRTYFSEDDLYDVHLADTVADPDGDGNSNHFEFLAKLDPTDREVRFNSYFSGAAREELRIGPVASGVSFETRFSTDLEEWGPSIPVHTSRLGTSFLSTWRPCPPGPSIE